MRRGAGRVLPGALAIAATGLVLGLAFNGLGLAARPSRGLPWIAQPRVLPSFEETIGAGVTPPGDAEGAESPDPDGGPETGSAYSQLMSDPMGLTASEDPGRGLPDVPELGRPMEVRLALVKKFFDAGEALIVDARDRTEFSEGHIPGAINLPYEEAASDPALLESLAPEGRPVIVYCGGGTCEVSMTLAETMVYQVGFRKVLVYMGGYPEWEAMGYPIATGGGERGRS